MKLTEKKLIKIIGNLICSECGVKVKLGGVVKKKFYCLHHYNLKMLEISRCTNCNKKREVRMVNHMCVCSRCEGNMMPNRRGK